MRPILRTLWVLPLALLAWSCATNPVTGRREITLLSEADEIRLGAQSDAAIVNQYGLLDDPAMEAYVEQIGERMVPISHRPQLDFHFRVLDDPVVNAFALPGGYIYITRGILGYLNDEAALAGVIGHEIGHVTAKHGVQQYTQQTLLGVGLAVGSVFNQTVANLAGTAGQLLLLKYGRDDERESDRLGVEYATKLGYDTDGMAEFFQTLGRLSGDAGGRLPSWASTHPDPGERHETVLQLTDQWQAQVAESSFSRDRDAFLQRLEGLVFGSDPRQGFLTAGEFVHPDLEFRFPVPAGWRYQNAPTQVTMVAPRGDLGVIFQGTGASSVAEAVEALAATDGVQVLARENVRLAVGTAVRTTARAGAGADAQDLSSTFLAWNGVVFVFHGIAPAGGLTGHRSAVDAPANGFAALTDPALLGVEPVRIRIVEAARSGPFREAVAAYPIPDAAGLDLAGLALLNGMEADSGVRAGQKLKILR